ncbi:MAG: hypothetical protein FWG73_02865 [Planctomycetaceae bacterium]|nr:hypothetical protein [Planctomycetaceae bacterium]
MPYRTAFTLVEILLVLVIMVLIATLGIPALRGTLAQQQLRYSADQIRSEWLDTRVRAAEEGQILSMRAKIGGSTLVIDRVLDTHFTAGLSSRQTTSRFDLGNEFDPFERGGFTGDMQDFILRNPDDASTARGAVTIELPRSVIVADVIALADERSAFYLGISAPGEFEAEEFYEIDALMTGEVRLGEMPGSDGTTWSTPIFFYPDGSTSTAAILLKNESGRCLAVHLRGLTGSGSVTAITRIEDYVGELDPHRH